MAKFVRIALLFNAASWLAAVLVFLYFGNQYIFYPAVGVFIETDAFFVFVLPIIASLILGLNLMCVQSLSLSLINQRIIQGATLTFEVLLFFNVVLIFLFNF